MFMQVLMMEAVRTSELSVFFHDTTRHYIPESCHFQWCITFNFATYLDFVHN
jgi:hypothetical protein